MKNKLLILGGGIAGLSFAYFYKKPVCILEREATLGGLCRSFYLNGIAYDIGPHIIFSKHKDILDLHNNLIEVNQVRRSNKILFKGRFVKYPFENELSALSETDRDYCLTEFLNNPYENYSANNMLQFFLKIFGEGITRLYLQPYNEKIWKFDPSYMDLQMVERIPKPPKEDIIQSAQGIATEGYTHQLYFTYPKTGGIQSLVDAYYEKVKQDAQIVTTIEIYDISRQNNQWIVNTNHGQFQSEYLINTMPMHELANYLVFPEKVQAAMQQLKYNSIYIVMLQFKEDNIGNNFAVYVPDKDIIFHRLSKLNFLGEAYCLPEGGSTLMLEITYRPGSYLSQLSMDEILEQCLQGLEKLNLASRDDLIDQEIKNFKYAYVIYDLQHRTNTDILLNYLKSINIIPCGRFAEFEYMNSDQVVYSSKKRVAEFLEKLVLV